MASRTPTPDGEARERLPNLFEVLSRRTLAPVDLYSFYIYMRDVQRSVDYLDFWYVTDDSFRARAWRERAAVPEAEEAAQETTETRVKARQGGRVQRTNSG